MNNAKHDAGRCKKINTIRAKARGITVAELAGAPCPTCGRSAHASHFRADARGHGVEGCVDAHHALASHVGEFSHWFHRPAAQAIRADWLAFISR